ncbi:MAG TPA: hypothetical protein VJW20_20615 [Candidatus Angelobacter sp.]|nr:hypothetical protein [Candidatus Angelobacter sp.]
MSAPAPPVDEKDRREFVKDLAEAVSTQSEAANRTWLALITVALFALVPHTNSRSISLPFSLGDVPQAWFHGFAFTLLWALAVAFAVVHSQQVRAQKLAQGIIDSLGSILGPTCNIHPRDYFDMCRKASLIHVASLAQSLRGKYQFYTAKGTAPTWLLVVTIIAYAGWKLIAFSIYFAVPFWALWQTHENFSAAGLLHTYNAIGTWAGSVALGQVLVLDILHAGKILTHLWRSAKRNER